MKIFNKLFNHKKIKEIDSSNIRGKKECGERIKTATNTSHTMEKPSKMKKSSSIEKSRKKLLKKQYKEGIISNSYDERGFNSKGIHNNGTKYDDRGFDKNGLYLPYCNKDGKFIFNSIYDFNGYDVDGYDVNGYNREGYNRKGYDKNGFDKNGVHMYGAYFDYEGYGSDGTNVEGLDREGYNSGDNKEEYSSEEFDKNDFDIEGYNIEGEDKEYIIDYFRKYIDADIDSIPEKDKLISEEVLKILTIIKHIDNSINIIDNYPGALSQTRTLVELFCRELLSSSELLKGKELLQVKGYNLPLNDKNSLYKNLVLIEKYNLLSNDEIDLLHEIRILANNALHDAEIKVNQEDAIYYFSNVQGMINKWIEVTYKSQQ